MADDGQGGPEDLRVRPGAALRPGSIDPVLVLWAMRQAFWPLIVTGITVAVAAGRLESDTISQWTSPGEILSALLTPLAGIAAAVLVRIAVGWLALAAAWPLSRWEQKPGTKPWWRSYRGIVDRWRLAQVYRTLRWTWGVRAEAIERAGPLGRRLGLAAPITTIATIAAVVAFFVVSAAR